LKNESGKVLSGCFGFFLLFVLVGILTNLYRSYTQESARSERLTITKSTVVNWEEKWMNNGEEQYQYAQCTVRFSTEDGTEIERRLLTQFDSPEVGLDEPLMIVYDPSETTYIKAADDPDEWPQTWYYLKTSVLCLILLGFFVFVARSEGSKPEG
jgi:hypothetical protein